MRKRYVNIPLPDELAKRIEEIIKSCRWGYKTKSEFVKEAVRQKLFELEDMKKYRKIKKG